TWDVVCQIQHRDHNRDKWMQKDNITDSEGLRQTVAQHGDIAERSTWEKAFIALYPEIVLISGEPGELIGSLVDRFQKPEWKPLLRPLLCHLMKTADGCEQLRDGLNAIRDDGWLFSDSPCLDTLSIIQEMVGDDEKNSEQLRQLYE
ncbi:MAG: hypothetical protein LH647_18595, partial [Leptolyngbyaceae cyanobacterium CAN_BIN12]|nr:hypothetical protein [Leptolyngbyaceae cyanobacterium CAN_BIN12]